MIIFYLHSESAPFHRYWRQLGLAQFCARLLSSLGTLSSCWLPSDLNSKLSDSNSIIHCCFRTLKTKSPYDSYPSSRTGFESTLIPRLIQWYRNQVVDNWQTHRWLPLSIQSTAPIENPCIIRELTVIASDLRWGRIWILGYSPWSCLDICCAVLACQPLFECQHGDAPFFYCWFDRPNPKPMMITSLLDQQYLSVACWVYSG